MEIINQTDFKLAWMAGRLNFPGHSLTLLVKATFSLKHDAKIVLAAEQLYPTGDEYFPDDDDQQGSIRYSSDFAYFKPRADLLLVGKCHPPAGIPSQRCAVTFGVGSRSKSLVVLGDRYWKGMLSTISEPVPFTQMDIRYENSYGGDGFPYNPVGKGYRKEESESGDKIRWLPNILHPEDMPDSPQKSLEPAGFGPLLQTWQQRKSFLGTYKKKYLEQRWPWFPEDFDWSYFNAAPPAMQMAGYLRGDEELFFENLHPEYPKYRSQLPGILTRCFVKRNNNAMTGHPHLEEVTLNLDTLWVDMETETLILIWRGWTQVLSEDLEDVDSIFFVSESLDGSLKTLAQYRTLFRECLNKPENTINEFPGQKKIERVDIDAEISKAEEEARVQLMAAGLDPDNPPALTDEDREREKEILLEYGFEEEKQEGLPLTRELVIEQFNRGEPLAGKDLSGLDLSELSLAGVDLQGCILTGTIFSGSNLAGADLTGALMPKADLSRADLSNATLEGTDLTLGILNHANLSSANLHDAVLENASLRNAGLEKATAEDAFFSGADLSSATIVNSNLRKADFSRCLLHNADFTGSDLSEASLEGAKGHQMKMERANLTELRASEGCEFAESSFRQALAPESMWESADLTAADLSFAHMEGADFTSACLERANLFGANLKFSRFGKANLKEANFVQMNLFQGSLKKADLSRADFRGSNLYGVEFLDSIRTQTLFDHANIKMTKLSKK